MGATSEEELPLGSWHLGAPRGLSVCMSSLFVCLFVCLLAMSAYLAHNQRFVAVVTFKQICFFLHAMVGGLEHAKHSLGTRVM